MKECGESNHVLQERLHVVPGQHTPCRCGRVTFVVLADYRVYWFLGDPTHVTEDKIGTPT